MESTNHNRRSTDRRIKQSTTYVNETTEMKKEEVYVKLIDAIVDNQCNLSLIWWTTLSVERQVELSWKYRQEPPFNLSLRDIVTIYEQEAHDER